MQAHKVVHAGGTGAKTAVGKVLKEKYKDANYGFDGVEVKVHFRIPDGGKVELDFKNKIKTANTTGPLRVTHSVSKSQRGGLYLPFRVFDGAS